MTRRLITFASLTALVLAVFVPAAAASDHLFNAANAPGAAERGFANPVALNPSGVSGAAAQPGTVPGEGNPNAGQDQTTPAVDLTLVTVRSGGHGQPAALPAAASVTAALAATPASDGLGKMYGEHIRTEAMAGVLGKDVHPGMHRGFAGWTMRTP